MSRIITGLFCALLALLPTAASAQVQLSFHSFNGSVLVGRFPHTFIVLDGTLEANGERVHENYGFTAAKADLSALRGDVPGRIWVEEEKYLATTNRHFTVPISDAQYHAVIAEMRAWRDAPGKSYNLDRHNCVHFVARIAQIAGLHGAVPQNLVRRPKAWLNWLARLNPQLGAREVP